MWEQVNPKSFFRVFVVFILALIEGRWLVLLIMHKVTLKFAIKATISTILMTLIIVVIESGIIEKFINKLFDNSNDDKQ